MIKVALFAMAVAAGAQSAGCAILPASGPSTDAIVAQEHDESVLGKYVLIDIDERIAGITAAQPRESFKRVFNNVGPAPDLRIGVSDSVIVRIWEAGAGGLFSAAVTDRTVSAGSRTATIPDQVVARDGTI